MCANGAIQCLCKCVWMESSNVCADVCEWSCAVSVLLCLAYVTWSNAVLVGPYQFLFPHQIHDRNNRRKGWLWLLVWRDTVREKRGKHGYHRGDVGLWHGWSHCTCSQEAEGDECWYSVHFLPFSIAFLGSPAHRVCWLNFTWIFSSETLERLIEICLPIRLMMKFNHHNYNNKILGAWSCW